MPRKIYKGLSEAEHEIIKQQAWEEVSDGQTLAEARKSKRKSKVKLKAYEEAKSRLALKKRREHKKDKAAVAEQAQADAQLDDAAVGGVLPCQQDELKEPCYLDKLIIKAIWPGDGAPPPPLETVDDPAALDQEALVLQQKIVENQDEMDVAMSSGTSAMNETEITRIKAAREKNEDDLLDLTQRRASSGTPPTPLWAPPINPREFTIVADAPDQEQVTQPLAAPREQLKALAEQWHTDHEDHEEAKQKLQAFTKEKEKLARAKAAARLRLERAKRDLKQKELELREKLVAKAQKAVTEKEIAKATRKLQKFADRNTNRLKRTDKAHNSAKEKYQEASSKYRDYANGTEYTDCKNTEQRLRAKLRVSTKNTEAKVTEINALEKSILEQRNTLASGSVIEVTGGSEKRYISWLADDDGSLLDKTPELEIKLQGGETCSTDAPPAYRLRSKGHHHLVCTEVSGEKPVLSSAGTDELPKFKVYQVRHWDDKIGQVRIPGARTLQQAAQFFRAIVAVFSRKPATRDYKIEASACGVESTAPFVAGTDTLSATVKVYPADKYAISITTPPAFGQSYEREVTISKADKPVAETGQLQYESSGSQVEVSDKETTSTSQFGVTQSMQSTEHLKGYDASGLSKDKDVTITQSAQREGGTFGTMRTTTDASGMHHGEAYTGQLVTTNSYNWKGTAPTVVEQLSESGSVASRHDPATGQQMSVEEFRNESEQSGNVSSMTPGETLKRMPAVPGSFFPQVPVDISFTRNDHEDEFTQNIKAAVGTTIWLTRQLGVFIGRIGNVVPSMGYKFGFSVDFLNGKLLYQREWVAHWDKRVWLHQKGQLEIKIVTAKVFVFVGISVSVVILEFELGIEVHIKGGIGIQGSVENQHPDVGGDKRVGFGPTGSIGCGAEIRLIIGQADWCKASGDISTSIGVAATWWVAHQEGPHADLKIDFEGVKARLIFHLVLVGHWEKGHTLCKERNLWTGRYPKEFDDQLLNDQSTMMDKERAEAAKEAVALEKKIDARKAKQKKIDARNA